MKRFSILTVVMLLALSINSNAQLNYLFSANSKPYVPVEGGISPHPNCYRIINPAKDVLNITIPFGTNKMILVITDVSGRTVLNKAVQSIKGGSIEQLDISRLTAGSYFFETIMCRWS